MSAEVPSPGGARRPGEVPTRVLSWGQIKWLVTPNRDPGAAFTAGEVVVMPGGGHEPHVHPEAQELLYVISGVGTQIVGAAPAFPIGEGDAVYIPANVPHSTFNTGWRPLRFLVTYTPGGAETSIDDLPGTRVLAADVVPRWAHAGD